MGQAKQGQLTGWPSMGLEGSGAVRTQLVPNIFLLLLFVGTTFSSMQQNSFALSREGQYF